MPLFTSKALRLIVSASAASVFVSNSLVVEANELRYGGGGGSSSAEVKKSLRRLAPMTCSDGSDPMTYLAVLKEGEDCGTLTTVVDTVGGSISSCLDAKPDIGITAIFTVCEADKSTVSECTSTMAENIIMDLEPEPVTEPVAGPEGVERRVLSPDSPASAFFFPRQWHTRAMKADEAWDCGRLGSDDVTVAILDTGIDYEHLDLAGRVDLSRSASFIPSDDVFVAANFPGNHPVTDLNFHGTHVGSTVASNAIITAGVTSKVTLIGVKVCDRSGSCPFDAIFSGLVHAAINGADVVNMSLGGAFSKSSNPGLQVFIEVIFAILIDGFGITIVVSAGNSSIDLDNNNPDIYNTYCDVPGVICVSATGPRSTDSVNGPFYNVDYPAVGYTNYGTESVDVAAPGGSQVANGWVWQACSQTSQVYSCPGGTFALGIRGTSMAAPHVSGLAALLVEDLGRMPAQIKEKIEHTAEGLGMGGHDWDPYPFASVDDLRPYFGGNGRISASNAVCPSMCCSDSISGIYPVAYDGVPCGGFVHCNGMMQSTVLPCSMGTLFNPLIQACDWPNNFECPDTLCMPGIGIDRRE